VSEFYVIYITDHRLNQLVRIKLSWFFLLSSDLRMNFYQILQIRLNTCCHMKM